MEATFLNTRSDLELDRYFTRFHATFTRKLLVTFFDLVYILALNLPIFVIFAYYSPDKGFVDAFHNLVDKQSKPGAWRMFGFALWIMLCLYIYFVLIPSKTNYQTFFSSYMGMKAVSIDDNLNWKAKLSQRQLLRANFVPVFLTPLVFSIFFLFAAICFGDQTELGTSGSSSSSNNWFEKVVKVAFYEGQSFGDAKTIKLTSWSSGIWVYGIRLLFIVAFGIQVFYMFTVGASKKALNWFTRSNRMVYVNVERATLVMSTEDKPLPNVHNMEDVAEPGGREEIEEAEETEEEKQDEHGINFRENIDLDTETFLRGIEEQRALEEAEAAEAEAEGEEGEEASEEETEKPSVWKRFSRK